MTLPCERTRAIRHAREFLRSLLDPSKTKRVPKEIRKQAYWVLRHFPSDFDLQRAAFEYEEVFAKPELETNE